jgi:uroporphyrinogen-III synthase
MRRLFVLRPEPGASETLERARSLGLETVAHPLFQVEPVAWEAPDGSSFDALLLTSANALVHGGEQLSRLRGLPVHAVGEATAKAAREAGFDIKSEGDSGVERLLGSIEPDLRLLHLSGEHRREPGEARQHVQAITVYRSVEIAAPDGLRELGGQVAAIHSPRAAERLAKLVEELRIDRATVRLACISKAAQDAAGEGWEASEAAEKPRDEALLALAARLCDKPV